MKNSLLSKQHTAVCAVALFVALSAALPVSQANTITEYDFVQTSGYPDVTGKLFIDSASPNTAAPGSFFDFGGWGQDITGGSVNGSSQEIVTWQGIGDIAGRHSFSLSEDTTTPGTQHFNTTFFFKGPEVEADGTGYWATVSVPEHASAALLLGLSMTVLGVAARRVAANHEQLGSRGQSSASNVNQQTSREQVPFPTSA
jgi:hypothetical protein